MKPFKHLRWKKKTSTREVRVHTPVDHVEGKADRILSIPKTPGPSPPSWTPAFRKVKRLDQNIRIAGTTIVKRPINHREADLPVMEPALGAAVLLLADGDSVGEGDSTVVSVAVAVSVPDSVDETVVVIIFEVRVTMTDVVRERVDTDAVSAKIPVKLAVATETSDLADEASEAILELALNTTAPADSVAATAAELARATTLLAPEAASDMASAASELASWRALRISDALAVMAADTEAALVRSADSALLAAEATLVGIGTGRTVTPDAMLDATAATFDSAAEAPEAIRDTKEFTETLATIFSQL